MSNGWSTHKGSAGGQKDVFGGKVKKHPIRARTDSKIMPFESGQNMMSILRGLSPSFPLNLIQLSLFRTELCRRKASTSNCSLGEKCPFSHCLSWHRRNPLVFPYRPMLCPNTRFWTEARRMKVKTWCRRGRSCLFAHTKEEQMYHPMVYKTQVCRDWPTCPKPFCPFAHGLSELRDPEVSAAEGPMLEGPELVDPSVRDFIGEDKIKMEFERRSREVELINRYRASVQEALEVRLGIDKSNPSERLYFLIFETRQTYVAVCDGVTTSAQKFERALLHNDDAMSKIEITSDGLAAVPLAVIQNRNEPSAVPDDDPSISPEVSDSDDIISHMLLGGPIERGAGAAGPGILSFLLTENDI